METGPGLARRGLAHCGEGACEVCHPRPTPRARSGTVPEPAWFGDEPDAILAALVVWLERYGPSESLLLLAARYAARSGVTQEKAATALSVAARKTGMRVNTKSPLITRAYRTG